jgi:hypothetical protein
METETSLYLPDMEMRTCSRQEIQTRPLPGKSAVICMADSPEQLAVIQDAGNVVARLDLIFNDSGEAFGLVAPPSEEHARKIIECAGEHTNLPFLIMQCQVGVGRSQAVMAALTKLAGLDPRPVLERGTYNRKLYRTILIAAGHAMETEPLVSLAVRVKYAPDRLLAFLLSMRRQRYENWEVVAVTDGPNPAALALVKQLNDARVRVIETPKALGKWGHPYRQLGIDACRGEFIGLSNDDNYYVPGYLEQMVNALRDADLAMCKLMHNYFAWDICPAGTDLGAWIGRAELVKKVPWKGEEFTSDQDYIKALKAAAKRVVSIERALFVHN